MKNIVIDVGNTHIVLGIFQDNLLEYSFRLKTDKLKTEDEYFSIIHTLISQINFDIRKISKFAISSVVPELSTVFSHLAKKYFNLEAIVVDGYMNLGLSFPISDPGFIGPDLIVNAFAAKEKYKTNCIICDFGTATTIQLVGKDGYFYGTVIAPGVITSALNLFASASLLSSVQLKSPKKILGTNTKDALLSGIVTGNTLMIDGIIKRIKKEYNNIGEIIAIATGGIAEMICTNSTEIDKVDKTLTLAGLNYICKK